MSNKPPHSQSPIHFFAVRIWSEQITEKKDEWRGTLRNGTGGTHQHFVGLDSLIELISALLEDQPNASSDNTD